MGLTKRQIDRARYTGSGGSRCVLWHDDPHGLGVRIFPSGHKAFVLSYRVLGRKRLMALADCGVITLKDAEKRARAEIAALEANGRDPLVEKRRAELEAKTGTVEALFRAYIAGRAPKRANEQLKMAERLIFPQLGARSWRQLRRSEVRTWHAGIDKPYMANRALQALRASLYWRLWQEDDAPEGEDKNRKRDTRNPCSGIPLRPERPRKVRLEIEQLPKLLKAIDAETKDPYLRAYFRFVLHTGCRRTEALTLKWDDVSATTVTFRETKSGEDRVVPLSAAAVKLLDSLPRIEGNPYVFVGHKRGTHLAEPNKAWARIRIEAGVPHLRIHDLRRTFGSWLGDAGFTSKQIGTVLGHKTDITSRVYMQLGEQTTRAAVDAVDKIIGGKKARVTKIRRAK